MGLFRELARNGPCDGMVGSVRRQADLALKKGHLIKSAKDFSSWGIREETSAVDYLLVEGDPALSWGHSKHMKCMGEWGREPYSSIRAYPQ